MHGLLQHYYTHEPWPCDVPNSELVPVISWLDLPNSGLDRWLCPDSAPVSGLVLSISALVLPISWLLFLNSSFLFPDSSLLFPDSSRALCFWPPHQGLFLPTFKNFIFIFGVLGGPGSSLAWGKPQGKAHANFHPIPTRFNHFRVVFLRFW